MKNIVNFPDSSLIEEEACQWIIKFDGDQPPSQQDIKALTEWIAQSPLHRQTLLQYSALWSDMDLLSELLLPLREPETNRKPIGSRLLGWALSPLMALQSAAHYCKQRAQAWSTPARWATACSLALCVVLSLVLINALTLQSTTDQPAYRTTIGERASFPLSDGSVLWLNTDSEVNLNYDETGRRIVLLRGEAFFKVAKDKARPFEVYAGSRLIRAVGTAFSVYRDHANHNSSVRVTVAEGKVDFGFVDPGLTPSPASPSPPQTTAASDRTITELPASNADAEIQSASTNQPGATRKSAPQDNIQILGSLSAGQSILLAEKSSDSIEKVIHYERQELARQLSWREGLLVFAGESLADVVDEISRYTSVKITLADPELKSLRIGGQFQTGETEALFDVLETGFGLKISRLNKNHVEIHKVTEDKDF